MAEPLRTAMRNIAIIVLIASLAGCGLTPTQQKWAGFAAGVLIVGAVAAHKADHGDPIEPGIALNPPPHACQSSPHQCRY